MARGDQVVVWTPGNKKSAVTAIQKKFTDLGVLIKTKIQFEDYNVLIASPILTPNSILSAAPHMPVIGWVHENRVGVMLAHKTDSIREALERVGRFIFPSADCAASYHSYLLEFPPEMISIIPYAVAEPIPCKHAPKKKGVFRILFVGSLYPRKRPSDLIRAVDGLDRDQVECHFIGEHEGLDPESRDLIHKNPARFVLHGALQQQDIARLYRSADLFCMPSWDESFGIAALEAASYGVPPLLSDLKCYEGLWKDGYNCLTHPVGDMELLRAYIKLFMDNPNIRTRLGNEAQKVPKDYSLKRFFTNLDTLLTSPILRR